jgi:hypothetical protein
MKTWTPNLLQIELCLTYRCNVLCNNCSNLCTQAPCPYGDLPVEKVNEFFAQSVSCNHPWKKITLHGGEPILHKDIETICGMAAIYKDKHNPTVIISLLSNGCCDKTLERLDDLKERYHVELGISEKVRSNRRGDGTPIPYIPVNESPEDIGIEHDNGCFQTSECGICLNYLGYFECSPAAAAARVFGYKPLKSTVEGLSIAAMQKGFKEHCKHCGFSAPNRPRVIAQSSTKTWEKALEKYKCRT